jgi:hypothetical protein
VPEMDKPSLETYVNRVVFLKIYSIDPMYESKRINYYINIKYCQRNSKPGALKEKYLTRF